MQKKSKKLVFWAEILLIGEKCEFKLILKIWGFSVIFQHFRPFFGHFFKNVFENVISGDAKKS